MQTGLLHLHNFLRWVILALLILSILKAYAGWKGKKTFNLADKKTALFTMIAAHTTLLLGIFQVLWGRYGFLSYKLPEGTSVMKDKFLRFFLIEHPTLMLIAVVLITLGHGMYKKDVSDEIKYKSAFLYFLVALIILIISIPWPFREIVGRPYFPGIAG